jgi:hypothetical protein
VVGERRKGEQHRVILNRKGEDSTIKENKYRGNGSLT